MPRQTRFITPIDKNGKQLLSSTTEYKDWVQLKKDYLEWLRSDGAAMGLMRGATKFGQREHVAGIQTLKEDVGSSLQDSCHSTSEYQCPLLLSGSLRKEMG